VLWVCHPGQIYVPMECDKAEGTLKRHLLTNALGVLLGFGSALGTSAATTAAASLVRNQTTDSLPFAVLIGAIALGAVLVLRKMLRDLF
jgi:drug/metabolite transporter (DMT)-like permease